MTGNNDRYRRLVDGQKRGYLVTRLSGADSRTGVAPAELQDIPVGVMARG